MQTKLNPNKVEIWSQTDCPACQEAKRLLSSYNIEYTEYLIGDGLYTREDLLEKVPNARSVPQILIGGISVGGLQEIKKRLDIDDNDKTTTMG